MIDAAHTLTQAATVEDIRARFPALKRQHSGYAVAYFDGPGGTQVPSDVVDAVSDYLINHNANTHWAYPTSEETDAALDSARATIADFFNAKPAEVAFGANMTTLTFHLARTLGYRLGPGDEVVVTELEHHANIAPWQALVRERNITVRLVKMRAETGELDSDDLARLINKRTRIVAIGAASNALGTINDIASAIEMARSVGALVFVDAVHYAPHALIDVRAMDCDFLSCSAYKFYGPHVGVLYGKQELLESLDFPKLLPAPDYAPELAETGTQNHEGIVGAAAAVDFLSSLAVGDTRRARLQTSFETLHARGAELTERLWEGLSSIPGVTLYGLPPGARRTPTVAFTLKGWPSIEVSRFLAGRGIFASHGDFYAATVTERLGLAEDGLVRAGCVCYTTPDEIERLIEGVRAIK